MARRRRRSRPASRGARPARWRPATPVASLDGRPLGKPACDDAAVAQLLAMSGREVSFFTAVALVADGGRVSGEALDRTRVQFRDLSPREVRDYVARDRPLDCAGAFRCESLGIALFRAIRCDDPTALVGLPLIATCTLLREAGMAPLDGG